MTPDPPKTIKFVPSGRGKAQCPPDPRYPMGIAINMGAEAPYCTVALPYPAPECGLFFINCDHCTMEVVVTAAGRPDDPTSIKIPCKEKRYA